MSFWKLEDPLLYWRAYGIYNLYKYLIFLPDYHNILSLQCEKSHQNQMSFCDLYSNILWNIVDFWYKFPHFHLDLQRLFQFALKNDFTIFKRYVLLKNGLRFGFVHSTDIFKSKTKMRFVIRRLKFIIGECQKNILHFLIDLL